MCSHFGICSGCLLVVASNHMRILFGIALSTMDWYLWKERDVMLFPFLLIVRILLEAACISSRTLAFSHGVQSQIDRLLPEKFSLPFRFPLGFRLRSGAP